MTPLRRARIDVERHRETVTKAAKRMILDGRSTPAGLIDLFVIRMASFLMRQAIKRVNRLESERMIAKRVDR